VGVVTESQSLRLRYAGEEAVYLDLAKPLTGFGR
jgi:hypothetical protein